MLPTLPTPQTSPNQLVEVQVLLKEDLLLKELSSVIHGSQEGRLGFCRLLVSS